MDLLEPLGNTTQQGRSVLGHDIYLSMTISGNQFATLPLLSKAEMVYQVCISLFAGRTLTVRTLLFSVQSNL